MQVYAAETERLYLERLSLEKHLEDFHELWNNDQGVLWSSKSARKTVEESRGWMVDFVLPTKENWEVDKFALLLKPSTQPEVSKDRNGTEEGRGKDGKLKMIGFVGTNRWSKEGMEVGYCMNVKYWGRGFASEAFLAFLKLFWTLPDRKGIAKLVAKTHPDNWASRRVCVKCGGIQGETLKGAGERFVDEGVKSDQICWYFYRPGVEGKEGAEVGEETEVGKGASKGEAGIVDGLR